MNANARGEIDGDTLIFATPGDPVAQMRLPSVMGPVFAALAINAVWLPLHVDRDGLGLVLQALRSVRNFKGITVAIPYKPVVAELVERLSERARAAGAVNLVRLEPDGSLAGDMVDGAGFVRGLEMRGCSPKGAKAPASRGMDVIRDIEAEVLIEATPTNFKTGEPGFSHMKAAFEP